jgi:PAS domain S-box-containing protein
MALWDWDLTDNVVTVDGIGHEMFSTEEGGRSPDLGFFLSVVVDEDRDRVARAARASFRTSTPFVEQFRVDRDGEVRAFEARGHVLRDSSGEPVRFVGVANDVTEELRRSERDTRLGQVLTGSPLEIYVVDPATLEIVEVNAVACEHLGYTEDELRSLPLDAIVATKGGDATSTFGSVGRGEIDQAFGPVRHRRKDGSTYPVEVRMQGSTFDGRPAVIGIALDVTDRVEAEQRQRDLEAQLWRAQKLDALGTLASGVAHDFNNLLMAIRMSTELASQHVADESPAGDHLARIVRATEHGKVLARQILTFGSEGDVLQTPTELGPVVNEAIELLAAALPATVRLRLDVADQGCVVLSQGSQIGQVVSNLCTNAAQALMGMPGVIDVRLEPCELSSAEAAQLPNLEPGRHVQLTVADTGVGMAPDVMERIFDPFFSTKGPDGGAGLGLAVVHGIVHAHGGSIDVESEPGVGTTIRVLLPSAERRPAPSPSVENPIAHGSGRVLLVDDVAAIAEALGSGLEEMGYEVSTFSSSTAAAAAFARDPSDFDLVVTDQTMPEMEGLQLAERLRALRPDLPIVLISGVDASFVDDEEMRQAGISEVLAKPFGIQELAAALSRSSAARSSGSGAGGRV